jgi:FtsH-binding integral membrane protein
MEQNNQYQTGGYAPYQADPMMTNQPQGYQQQPIYQAPQDMPVDKPGIIDDTDLSYSVRKGFIVKTYGILLSQLAITCAFICLSFIPAVKEIVQQNIHSPLIVSFLIVFVIVTLIVVIVFSCCRQTARTVPINYILLFSFTLCMSFYCLLFTSFFPPDYVISAALLTFGATVGLTIYAAKTDNDFTFCGAFLFAFLLIIIFSAILFFWVGYIVFILLLGILIYSLYIIYDTQLILGNKTFEYNVDDYCLAALNLYIDIIYMFIKILQLISVLKGGR